MSHAKVKTGKTSPPRQVPENISEWIKLIIDEIESPAYFQALLERMPTTTNCQKEAAEFLKAKDRAQRRQGFIKNEEVWFKKYGWFMARVVILFGLLIAVMAAVSRGAGVDFITALIMGAAGYYLLLFTLSNVRYREGNRKRKKLIEKEEQRYQREIVPLASSLMKRFSIDPSRYRVAKPKSRAGLEEREDGFFIPAYRE